MVTMQLFKIRKVKSKFGEIYDSIVPLEVAQFYRAKEWARIEAIIKDREGRIVGLNVFDTITVEFNNEFLCKILIDEISTEFDCELHYPARMIIEGDIMPYSDRQQVKANER